MDRKEIFWEDVAEFIQQYFKKKHPSKWDRSIILEFLGHLEEVLLKTTRDNKQLAETCKIMNLKGAPKWKPMSPTTIENIFRYNRTKGDVYTRDIFAVYMGYNSYQNYIRKKYPLENVTKSSTHENPISVVVELKNADFSKEDKVDQWMIYELAFLWFGKEPPSIQAHFYQMTREMEALKKSLHQSVEKGFLEAKTEVFSNGVTRYVTRESLEKFINDQKLDKPEFLKKDER